jgi:phospholipid transport system substrate-binding protein
LLAVVVLVGAAQAATAAIQPKVAEVFIKTLADQAVATLADNTISVEEREARFRKLLKNGFDMSVISRFVAGRYWRKMTTEQKADYQNLFTEWTLKSYAARLGGYADQKFEIIKTIDTGKKDIFVSTRIVEPGNPKGIRCDWRVRPSRETGQPIVVDVVVEGISMLVTQKSEFSAVLQKRGVEGLIQMLRVRVSKFQPLAGG